MMEVQPDVVIHDDLNDEEDETDEHPDDNGEGHFIY